MFITLETLQKACTTKAGKSRAVVFYPFFEKYFTQYGITTYDRERMFFAQVLHESGEFQYVKELGSDKYLSKYDTGSLAARLGNSPEPDGDGQLYRGRGLIQLTGLTNYKRFKVSTGIDVVANPAYLETLEGAVHSACWFWFKGNLNSICTDIRAATKRINGGYNGIEDRINYFNRLVKS